jgi:hypothetical protein
MTAAAPVTILDHIDNIAVPGDVFRQPVNEYWALVCFRQGMEFLYRQAARCDQVVKQRVNPDDKLHIVSYGNLPESGDIPKALLTCAFHWYALSAYQYALIVGAIAHKQDSSRPIPPAYVKSVMPEVLAYRDKVAAHVAWAKNNSKDNDAERLASVLPPLTYVDDSFQVGTQTVMLQQQGKVSDSRALQPWSICKVHEKLRKRYWPDE